MYFLILNEKINRSNFIKEMNNHSIQMPFHYIPLHTSPAIKNLQLPLKNKKLATTEKVASQIVRLPLWIGVESKIDEIYTTFKKVIQEI